MYNHTVKTIENLSPAIEEVGNEPLRSLTEHELMTIEHIYGRLERVMGFKSTYNHIYEETFFEGRVSSEDIDYIVEFWKNCLLDLSVVKRNLEKFLQKNSAQSAHYTIKEMCQSVAEIIAQITRLITFQQSPHYSFLPTSNNILDQLYRERMKFLLTLIKIAEFELKRDQITNGNPS